MKRILFIFNALLVMVQAQAVTPDTVTVIDKPNQVIITETPSGTLVKVSGTKENENYNYTYTVQHSPNDTVHTTQSTDWDLNVPFMRSSRKEKTHWTIESKGLYFGGGQEGCQTRRDH